jgi:hypothetical protein
MDRRGRAFIPREGPIHLSTSADGYFSARLLKTTDKKIKVKVEKVLASAAYDLDGGGAARPIRFSSGTGPYDQGA